MLLAWVYQGRYHSEQRAQPVNREPAGERRGGSSGQARCRQRNDAFNTRIEPHDADAAKALLSRHSHQWEGELIQRVRWVSNCDRVGRQCS